MSFESATFENAWIDGDRTARWRSASGHGPADGAQASGSSLLEVEGGCRLPVHTDSAEETVVVVNGVARVAVGTNEHELSRGGVALIPANVEHEVRSEGAEPLRFVALYAGTDVVTTYRDEVQPDGEKTRKPVS